MRKSKAQRVGEKAGKEMVAILEAMRDNGEDYVTATLFCLDMNLRRLQATIEPGDHRIRKLLLECFAALERDVAKHSKSGMTLSEMRKLAERLEP